jgi:hypothetical protein
MPRGRVTNTSRMRAVHNLKSASIFVIERKRSELIKFLYRNLSSRDSLEMFTSITDAGPDNMRLTGSRRLDQHPSVLSLLWYAIIPASEWFGQFFIIELQAV